MRNAASVDLRHDARGGGSAEALPPGVWPARRAAPARVTDAPSGKDDLRVPAQGQVSRLFVGEAVLRGQPGIAQEVADAVFHQFRVSRDVPRDDRAIRVELGPGVERLRD